MQQEIFFFFLLTASLFDISQYRVPNTLFVLILIISLFGRLEAQGLFGLWLWLGGIIIPFVLCYLLYRCRMFGASDCKMFSVIGSFAGVYLCLKIMALSLFVGSVMAAAKMIHRKNFKSRFRHLFNYAACCLQAKRLTVY